MTILPEEISTFRSPFPAPAHKGHKVGKEAHGASRAQAGPALGKVSTVSGGKCSGIYYGIISGIYYGIIIIISGIYYGIIIISSGIYYGIIIMGYIIT